MILDEIPKIKHLQEGNFFLIAGSCAIESEELAFQIAEHLVQISSKYHIPYIFKGSYRKANRSRIDSFTGIGDEKTLQILAKIGEKYDIPTLTDIHESHEAKHVARYVDVIQIPAFLCRQTDLLLAAALTGKYVNVKKGQFLSGASMQHVVDKFRSSGNEKIMLTDRGNCFGYQDLVVDYRNLVAMKTMGVPVIMDCTHALQQPNQETGVTSGQPNLIETIAKAAIAVGADGLFIETHPNPEKAKSDGANMLKLELVDELMAKLLKLRKAVL